MHNQPRRALRLNTVVFTVEVQVVAVNAFVFVFVAVAVAVVVVVVEGDVHVVLAKRDSGEVRSIPC